MSRFPDKLCERCGRPFAWRRAWAASWPTRRYCSRRCAGERRRGVDAALEREILAMTARRGRRATLCPSEPARAVGGDTWRDLMQATRYAVNRLAARGLIEVLQRGARVDAATARGPIRIRASRDSAAHSGAPTALDKNAR